MKRLAVLGSALLLGLTPIGNLQAQNDSLRFHCVFQVYIAGLDVVHIFYGCDSAADVSRDAGAISIQCFER